MLKYAKLTCKIQPLNYPFIRICPVKKFFNSHASNKLALIFRKISNFEYLQFNLFLIINNKIHIIRAQYIYEIFT